MVGGSLLRSVLYLSTAAVLGAAIGFERQWRQRLAGLRQLCLTDSVRKETCFGCRRGE